MKINELKQQIEEGKNYKDIIEFISYIPFVKKKIMCESIADSCIKEENGMIICDHCMKQLTTDIMLINNYTNLEFNEESYVEEYDFLCENGIMKYIIEKIDGEEYWFIVETIDKIIEQKIKVHNSIENIIAKELEKFVNVIDKNLNSKEINKLVKTVSREFQKFEPEKMKQLKSMMKLVK